MTCTDIMTIIPVTKLTDVPINSLNENTLDTHTHTHTHSHSHSHTTITYNRSLPQTFSPPVLEDAKILLHTKK